MANIKSQIKRNRQNEKARQRNMAARSEVKTATKRAEDTGTEADTRAAQKTIGKSAAKGRLHKNQAARRTSRLMKRAAKSS